MSRAEPIESIDDLIKQEQPGSLSIPDFLTDDWMKPAADDAHWL